jgi:hypothetical protein
LHDERVEWVQRRVSTRIVADGQISSVVVPVVVGASTVVLARVGLGNGGRDALHLLHTVLLPSVVGPLAALASTTVAQLHPRRVVGP